MVIEKIRYRWIKKKISTSIYIGFFFTLISFIASIILFHKSNVRHLVGISTILFTVVLTTPITLRLFQYEELIERKSSKYFLKKHRGIIDFFIYYFIGVFVMFFIMSLFFPGLVFSENQLFGQNYEDVVPASSLSRLPPPPAPNQTAHILSILKNNIYIMVLSFILSLFYGSGALFLIILNASVFASSFTDIIRLKIPAGAGFVSAYSYIFCNLSVFFFHMLPEIASYLIAAIAGGVFASAITREKFFSNKFNIVAKDSLILLGIAILLLIVSSIIEINISKKLFEMNVCIGTLIPIIISAFFIIVIIIYEVKRINITKR
ncbi:MAG: hypothetical protein V1740_07245 [Candidatus Woesearchaeota archaeon]